MDITNPDVQRYLAMDHRGHEVALGRLRESAISTEDPQLVAAELAWKIREDLISSGESGDHEDHHSAPVGTDN